MTFRREVVADHCQGKQEFPRDEANALARKHQAKGAVVQAYKCAVCGHWHVGGKT